MEEIPGKGFLLIRVFLKSDVVIQFMLKRNMTQKKLADSIGITDRHLSNLILCKYGVRPVMRKRLMDYFKVRRVRWDDLFTIKREEDEQSLTHC